MTVYVGDLYRKQPHDREAQVSALGERQVWTDVEMRKPIATSTLEQYAVMYWPDTNTQTEVRLDRLTPKHHWYKA